MNMAQGPGPVRGSVNVEEMGWPQLGLSWTQKVEQAKMTGLLY